MRIMHVLSSAASGGAEIYVRDLSIEMSKKGHDVFLLFLDTAKEAGRDTVFEENFLTQLSKHNIHYGFIGKVARKKPWKGIIALRRVAKQWQPDVVHAHLYYAAIFSLFIPNTRLFYTHHNIRLNASRHLYKILDRRVHGYVGICGVCTRLLEGVVSRPVIRIDNGVAMSRIRVKPPGSYMNGSIGSTPIKILFVGTLSEQKNLGLLFRSVKRLKEKNFHVDVAGEGTKRDELYAMAAQLEIEDKITFLGNVDDVAERLKEAELFVMSSAWEGLPIALIEATLTGLPVLVTDVGGCREIVEEVGNGKVVPVDDLAFSTALGEMIDNHDLRSRCHENALRNSSRYTIDASVLSHLKMYDNSLNRS